MKEQNEDKAFRTRLEEMTESDTEVQYLARRDAAISQRPESIERLQSQHPIGRYGCVMHVLDFTEKKEYIAIAQRPFNHRAHASPTFAQWLLDKGFLSEISDDAAGQGDLVLYFDSTVHIKHAGVYLGQGRVESKWGKADLFQHDLFAVPESYGNQVRFFKRLSYDDAFPLFKRFAKEQGMLFID